MSSNRTKAFLIMIALAGVYSFRLHQFPRSDDVLAELEKNPPPTLIARIVDEPDSSLYGLRARAKIMATCDGEGKNCTDLDPDTYVQISYSKPKIGEVEVSDIVALTGTIREMSFSPEQESLKNFFKKEKIYYEIKSAKISHVEKPFSIKRRLVRFRKAIEESIADALPRPHSDLGQGLVVSGKGSMSKDLLEKFKRVGLIHIVVLSGSNVSIIAAALMAALRLLSEPLRIVCGLTGMSFFALMTGAAPPVVRSVLMSSIPLVLAPLIHRRVHAVRTRASSGDPDDGIISGDVTCEKSCAPAKSVFEFSGISLLCLTGYVMCLFNPLFLLYDISFQLSFMATLGLVLYTKPISNLMARFMPFIPSKFGIREIIASSLGTQILVMPLLLQIGGNMSTVFLFANILVLPILPITMFCIFLTSLSSFIMPVATGAIGFVSWLFLEWILRVTDFFSGISFALVHVIDMERRGVIIYYIVVLSITALVFRKAKKSETNNAPT
jgi:competence protein ComEC